MKKKLISLVSLLLITVLMFSLVACGKKENAADDGSGSGSNTSSGSSSTQTLAQELGYGYVASYDSFPEDVGSVSTSAYHDGKLYFTSYIWDEVTYESSYAVYSLDPETMEVSEYAIPTIGDQKYSTNINNFQIDSQGNMWFMYYQYYYPEEEYYAETYDEAAVAEEEVVANDLDSDGYYEAYVLCKADAQGNIISQVNLSELDTGLPDSDYVYYYNFKVDDEGYVYLPSDQNLIVLDPELNHCFNLSVSNWINNIYIAADGTVYCMYYDNEYNEVLAPIDKTSKSFGAEVKTSDNALSYSCYDGGASGYDLLSSDGNTLYGFTIATGELTPILSWLDCDVDGSNSTGIFYASDDVIFTFSWDEDSGNEILITLKKTPVSEIPQKTLITYAYTDYLNWNVRSRILSFNRTNEKYRITLLDYSQYNTDDDQSLGLTRLNNDILAGNVPDIIGCNDTGDGSIDTWSEKGILLDLYTLIDADGTITRDSFVSGILKAQESDGKLASISPSFYLMTTMAMTSVVGDVTGWTFEEMMDAYESLGDGAKIMSYTTKSSFLSYCLNASWSNYVDKETGECHFNSDDFINLLKVANTLPDDDTDFYSSEDGDYEDESTYMAKKKVLCAQLWLGGFTDIDYYRGAAAAYGEDFSLVGAPCSSRNGHSINFDYSISVSATTENKDGIWEFIKSFLSDDYQTDDIYSFPVMQSAFDAKAEAALEPPFYYDENGEKVTYDNTYYIEDQEIVVPPLTEAELNKIITAIEIAGSSGDYDSTISEIINEEAASFFDGQKTAEAVADLIQNRVQTYIMEQR